MRVLAFDTALSGCSAAFFDTETDRCFSESKPMMRGQSETLVPMIKDVIEAAGCSFADIDLIGTTIGPGAFTGLRIGLSTAKSLGLALDKPVVGVTTFEVLAAQFFATHEMSDNQLLCVLIETKRQDYYAQIFKADGKAFTPPQALAADELADVKDSPDVVFIGDAAARFLGEDERFIKGFELPDPAVIGQLAFERFESEGAIDVEPLYLRGADVSKSKKKQRVIAED